MDLEISHGIPLLQLAVISEGIENKSQKPLINFLVKNGAQLELQDEAGNTALHYACSLCRTNLIEVLVKKGASFKTENFTKQTPIDVMPDWCKSKITI